jgi:hypothetical protein
VRKLNQTEIRDELKDLNLSFTEIAKRVGERWQQLNPEGKEPFESQAALNKEKYNQAMARYKRTSSYRDYQEYLADFKAKALVQAQPGPPKPPTSRKSHPLLL